MSKVVSKWLVVPAALTLIGAIVYANPVESKSVIQDDWKTDDPAIRAVRDEMDARQHQVSERITIKEALITDLIDGRRSLEDVSQQFLQLNRESPNAMQILRMRNHHLSDEELITLNVLEYVSLRLVEHPQQAGILCKLEEQYRLLFGHPISEAGHH